MKTVEPICTTEVGVIYTADLTMTLLSSHTFQSEDCVGITEFANDFLRINGFCFITFELLVNYVLNYNLITV